MTLPNVSLPSAQSPDHFDAAVLYGVLMKERQDIKGAESWLRRAIKLARPWARPGPSRAEPPSTSHDHRDRRLTQRT